MEGGIERGKTRFEEEEGEGMTREGEREALTVTRKDNLMKFYWLTLRGKKEVCPKLSLEK